MKQAVKEKRFRNLLKEIKELENLHECLQNKDIDAENVVEEDKHALDIALLEHQINYWKSYTKGDVKYECNAVRSYKTDPVAFIERELMIFNPDLDPPETHFFLYKFQRDFINDHLYPAYRNNESLLDEKTRQMGMSWLYCAFALWGILFDRNFTGFMLSKKEKLVDDGGDHSTKDSLFGKIRYMYDSLSDEFKRYYKQVCRSLEVKEILTFKSLRILNEITGAYMVGSSANIDAGRGGTYKFAMWDETASTPKSEVIFQAFKLAGRCKCYNSTVRGRGNVFARLRWDETKPVEVVTLHWSQHPRRVEGLKRNEENKLTSDWYENECKGLTKTQIGQELDIDYETSVEGRIYGSFDRKVHFQEFEWIEDWRDKSIIAWDLGISDEMFGVVLQADGQGGFVAVDEICGEDKDVRFYIDLLCGVEPAEFKFMTPINKRPYQEFLIRSRDRRYKFLLNVAGPDVLQRSVTSKRSVMKQFTKAGQLAYDPITGKIVNRRYVDLRMQALTGFRILDRITEVKKLINPLHNRVVISSTRCPKLWERLVNYKWNKDAEGQNREVPDHNWASHGSDAFGYGILYFIRKRKIGILPGDTHIRRGNGPIPNRPR